MMTSQLTVIDVTEDIVEFMILAEYLNMRQKCLEDLCEFTYLQDFPQDAGNNYRRHIMKYTLDKYVRST